MLVDKNLAILTRYDSAFGTQFLSALAARGIMPALLIVAKTALADRLTMMRFLAAKIGWRDACRYNFGFFKPLVERALSGGRLYPLPDFSGRAASVLVCRNINAPEVADRLADPAIAKIVLAQSGIVREPILSLPGKWIVNAHPGMLPDFRGVDVVKWALLAERPVGVTLHIVRKGIDTGEILETARVPIYGGNSIGDVENRARDLSIDLLVKAAVEGKRAFPVPAPQPVSQARQYYLMPFTTAKQLEKDWPAKDRTASVSG